MESAHKQVYQWFLEKLTGNITPEDEAVLTAALSSDASLRALWDVLEEEAKGLELQDFIRRMDAKAGLEGLKTRIETRPKLRSVSSFRGAGVAAAALVIIAVGSYFTWLHPSSIVDREKISAAIRQKRPSVNLRLGSGRAINLDAGKSSRTMTVDNATLSTAGDSLRYTSGDTAQNTLSVPAGTKYSITLSDGTRVFLNAATNLRFPFRFPDRSREVYVDGEAYFQVAPDARRPFVVHTLLTQVRVLGTSFDVNTYVRGKVRTALVEGKVLAESKDGRSIALTAGRAADYDTANGFLSGQFEEDDEISWINGIYYFHDMPVADLARLASRCYGVHIVVDDRFTGKSITGVLETGKLPEFLNDLETTAHIKCRYSGNDLYFE